jgi:heat shock protein HtpX
VALIASLLVIIGGVIGEARGSGAAGVGLAGAATAAFSLVAYFAGDRLVLGISRARRLQKSDDPVLFNVVEEMAIAAGSPAPAVHLIDDTALNAFATGRKPATASVAITRGLRDKLSRDQLQGVIAHEISHIRNRDTLYLTMVGVMVGVVAMLCDLFLRRTFWGPVGGHRLARQGRHYSSGGRSNAANQAIFIVLALALAALAPLFAKFLQMAVSRRREYLADASAAEITRYPEGLASALEVIAGDTEILEVANRATQHLYIVNPIRPLEAKGTALFSTHPPIQERIRRLRAM